MNWLARSALILAILGSSGCATVGFYAQAISGHMSIMLQRRPVTEVIADTENVELRQRLQLASEARRFASAQLDLPENGSYTSYVDLGRNYVTYNVIATEEFSVEAREWCFPVAGCVPYRGYFNEASAVAYGEELAAEGLDVFVNGASAYSTLGWFDDPLLNTMLRWRETRLVGVIFHELAHQRVWLEGDVTFNESFAVFVQREGVRRWLRDRNQHELIDKYEAQLERQGEFITLLLTTRNRLEDVYAETEGEESKRTRKRETIERLRTDYQALRASWDNYTGYDAWFDRPINNARLALTGTYNDYVPGFARLFAEVDGSFEMFYQRVEQLAEMTDADREREIERLLSVDMGNLKVSAARLPTPALEPAVRGARKQVIRNN